VVFRKVERDGVTFRYNYIEDLRKIVSGHKNELAAIVIEPIRNEQPKDNSWERFRLLRGKQKVSSLLTRFQPAFD